jgi:hypothetical protein
VITVYSIATVKKKIILRQPQKKKKKQKTSQPNYEAWPSNFVQEE